MTDGVDINLDRVPKKYEGLGGTELAISESQERMAVVVRAEDADRFIAYAAEENLEATIIPRVTENPRLVMKWRGHTIVDISREFLNTNGQDRHGQHISQHRMPMDISMKIRLNLYMTSGFPVWEN